MIEFVKRKSKIIRYSGRSSDYISPSFGYGCLLDCSYCYMKRHLSKGLTIANNIEELLRRIDNHVKRTEHSFTKPNQTDDLYVTYDISCNEDFALHAKYHNWKKIFDFFLYHDLAKATLATKIIPTKFLEYNPNNKVRIRFSLMPQKLSTVFEPNTPKIIERIKAIDTFINAGYDVHINFSPVIIYKNWLKDYEDLFKLVNKYVKNKNIVKAEVIFLTHNINKHKYNINNNYSNENLLWCPSIQETKQSQYGGENVRYKWYLKNTYIEQFKELHNNIIPWNIIRYIF